MDLPNARQDFLLVTVTVEPLAENSRVHDRLIASVRMRGREGSADRSGSDSGSDNSRGYTQRTRFRGPLFVYPL